MQLGRSNRKASKAMGKVLDEACNELNDNLKELLASEMKRKFDLEIDTFYSIISMDYISRRVDGEDFTPEQHAYLAGLIGGIAASKSHLFKKSIEAYEEVA